MSPISIPSTPVAARPAAAVGSSTPAATPPTQTNPGTPAPQQKGKKKQDTLPDDPAKVKKELCVWNDKDDECLLAILEDAKAANEMSENGFKVQTYNKAAASLELIRITGAIKTSARVQDHFKNMKANWKEVKFLASQSGFGWDNDSSLVTAPADVWAALIKAKPAYKKWMRTSLWYYDRMDDLVAECTATGDYVFYPTAPPKPAASSTSKGNPITIDDDSDGEEAAGSDAGTPLDGEWSESETESKEKKRGAAGASQGSRKKQKPSALAEITSIGKSVGALVRLEKSRMEMDKQEMASDRSAADATTISLSALMQRDKDTFSGSELGIIAFEVSKLPALLATWGALANLDEARVAFLREIIGNAASTSK
ncbi:hypothetical protein A4X06_0g6807 [Tilletia controversa]|uniref:Myb/SANT-like domain-containing protein n=1 Tax=Tilletia controversa TaxID=13291 RepID=A0A8X7SUM5_9BASI|nr:hypothetical protein A4X06_0g6807 [Tilletia controversa]